MHSVSIESPIESLMVSPTIQSHQVVEYRIDLTEGAFTLLKPTIYPGPHDLVRQQIQAISDDAMAILAVDIVVRTSPPPKNVEQVIYEYVDRKKYFIYS